MTTERNQGYRVRRAAWPADQAALRRLREQVFVQEQGVPPELEWDGLDTEAIHLLAEDTAGRPVGTARVLASGQIGRMAVLPELRGRGIGAELLASALEASRGAGLPEPWLNAQTGAQRFYERAGFRPEGETFVEAGIPHRKMLWHGSPG
jgi:predicted GNAT family N-acyltransferase